MIVTKTPCRLSFVGGGTDLPGYSDKYGGQVISTTIDKYVYVTLNKKFDGRVSLRYSETEEVDHVDELKHGIVRECLKVHGIERGIEIVTISDVPMKGTGLGSSSALTVGLLHALHYYMATDCALGSMALAALAFRVEVEQLGAPIGRQDQWAAAIGGFNEFSFCTNEMVDVLPFLFAPEESGVGRLSGENEKTQWLESNTMLFYIGPREAEDILGEQSKSIKDNIEGYHSMKAAVETMRLWLENDEPNEDIGAIIEDAWNIKKRLHEKISNLGIDEAYKDAKKAGAIGGKCCGAGGGGFLMLIVPEEKQDAVRTALSPLREMPFKFSDNGSEVIYAD